MKIIVTDGDCLEHDVCTCCNKFTMINLSYGCHTACTAEQVCNETWWCLQMETYSALLALCEGNPLVIGGFPSQRLVTWRFFSLICAGVNVWANWYLRRHYARYDVTVMNMMNSRYVEQLLTYEFIKGYKHRIYGPIKDVCKKVIGAGLLSSWCVNTLRPKPNGWHFADNIFRCIWLNSYLCILIWMTLILGSRKVLIDNNSACNHLMAWSSTDKPLVEQGWRRSLMNICIIKPGWVNNISMPHFFRSMINMNVCLEFLRA